MLKGLIVQNDDIRKLGKPILFFLKPCSLATSLLACFLLHNEYWLMLKKLYTLVAFALSFDDLFCKRCSVIFNVCMVAIGQQINHIPYSIKY